MVVYALHPAKQCILGADGDLSQWNLPVAGLYDPTTGMNLSMVVTGSTEQPVGTLCS